MAPPRIQPRLRIRFDGKDLAAGFLSTLRLPLAWTSALIVATVPAYLVQRILNGRFDHNTPVANFLLAAMGLCALTVCLILFATHIIPKVYDLLAVASSGAPDLGAFKMFDALAAGLLVDLLVIPCLGAAVVTLGSPLGYALVLLCGLIVLSFMFFPHAVIVEQMSAFGSLTRSMVLVWRHLLECLVFFIPLLALGVLLTYTTIQANNAGKNVGFLAAMIAFAVLMVVPPAVTAVPYVRAYLAAVSAGLEGRPASARRAGAYVGYGRTAERSEVMGKRREAAEAASDAAGPSAADLFTKGMGLLTLGKPNEAVDLLQAASELDPDMAKGLKYRSACLALAEAFARAGEKRKARQFYQMVLDMLPDELTRNSIERKLKELDRP